MIIINTSTKNEIRWSVPFIQALLSSALFAAACAAPVGPPAYGAPAPYPAEPAYPDLPPVYKYNYAVSDDYSSSKFNAHEERDGYNANGGYQVALPDGRTQIVTYISGPVSTFHISMDILS